MTAVFLLLAGHGDSELPALKDFRFVPDAGEVLSDNLVETTIVDLVWFVDRRIDVGKR